MALDFNPQIAYDSPRDSRSVFTHWTDLGYFAVHGNGSAGEQPRTSNFLATEHFDLAADSYHQYRNADTTETKQVTGGCYDTAKRPKYRATKREEFVRNWEFYLNFPKLFECHPGLLPPSDPNGEEGKYSFLCLENGMLVPTREWDLVKRAQEGKESVNLQIKLWSEGMWDRQLGCPLFFPQEIREYCQGYPPWVYQAVIKQTKKRVLEDVGFIPTWLKVGDLP